MKYFNDCKTLEDLKKEYKKLAFKHHPDRGGSENIMKEINAEYDICFELLKNKHKSAEGKFYEKENNENVSSFKNIIEILVKLSNIEIEICGSWIWVTGNTKYYKETLKELKFKFSANKLAWYYHEEGYRKNTNKHFTLDEIRDFYGSEKIKKEELEKKQIKAGA